jgi:hypothetical protein
MSGGFRLFVFGLILQLGGVLSLDVAWSDPVPPVIDYTQTPSLPADFVRATEAEVPREIDFRPLLSYPLGTVLLFIYREQEYAAVLEVHYHPPGGAQKPWGKHKGVSLFIRKTGSDYF